MRRDDSHAAKGLQGLKMFPVPGDQEVGGSE